MNDRDTRARMTTTLHLSLSMYHVCSDQGKLHRLFSAPSCAALGPGIWVTREQKVEVEVEVEATQESLSAQHIA